jgi:hypothetical protein
MMTEEKSTYCDSCGDPTDSTSPKPYACSLPCLADIRGETFEEHDFYESDDHDEDWEDDDYV